MKRTLGFVIVCFLTLLSVSELIAEEWNRCSATFMGTEFGMGWKKHLNSDGTVSLTDKAGKLILDGCLRAEVLSWEARVIGFRQLDGSDGLISFDGTQLIDGMDDIYLVDETKRIFALRKNGYYGVMIFSDNFVKRKIKDKQSPKSTIIVRVNEDKNLTTDQSNLRGVSSVIDEDFWGSGLDISTYEDDWVGNVTVRYKTVQFYSKGKLYGVDQLGSNINVELILVQNEQGHWGVFDGYGNVALPVGFEADKIQIVNKSSVIAFRGASQYSVEIRDDYSTIDLGDKIQRIEFR